jgi:hypothetical protein
MHGDQMPPGSTLDFLDYLWRPFEESHNQPPSFE